MENQLLRNLICANKKRQLHRVSKHLKEKYSDIMYRYLDTNGTCISELMGR